MAQASKVEIHIRLRTVQEWILDDHSYKDIVNSAVSKWGVCDRQAKRYYSDAYALMSDGDEKNIERKRSYYISRKKKLIRDMDPKEKRTAAGVAAINRVLDSMAEIEGVKINKTELSAPEGMTIKIGYGQKETEV